MTPDTLMTVSDARTRFLGQLPQVLPPTEEVSLWGAPGRVLAQDVISLVNVPEFARSTKDGYAVRAADTFGVQDGLPGYFNVVGEVLMGRPATMTLGPGQAAHIPTGGMLPAEADAVVMVEYTELLDTKTVEIRRPASPGENVIAAGDDVRRGQVLLGAGHRLRPQDVGALAGVGHATVVVYRRPRVAILSTGDEIIPPEVEQQPGQIRDMNRYSLAAAIEAEGATVVDLGIVKDDDDALRRTMERGLTEADLVLVSGGSSVGLKDATPRVINSLGEPGVLIHGVALKPGKPVIFGLIGDKPVFGIPGNPVSTLITFGLFVRPVLRLRAGFKEIVTHEPALMARMSRSVSSPTGREEYLRVDLVREAGELVAVPVLGESGLLTTMVKARGLVKIPLGRDGIAAGEQVEVQVFGGE